MLQMDQFISLIIFSTELLSRFLWKGFVLKFRLEVNLVGSACSSAYECFCFFPIDSWSSDKYGVSVFIFNEEGVVAHFFILIKVVFFKNKS